MLSLRSALFLAPLIAFLFLAWLLLRGLDLDPSVLPSALKDKPAPAFSLPLLQDVDQRFNPESLKGKVWVLNVFASWCGPCREEHPLVKRLSDAGLAVVVGLNYKDPPDDARAWLARLGNPYAQVAIDVDGRVGIDWGVYGVPETFVIDPQGVIRFKHVGPLTAQVVDEQVLPLLRRLAAS